MYRKNISLIVLFVILITLKLSAQDISTGIKLMRNEKFAEAKKCFTGLLTSKSKADSNHIEVICSGYFNRYKINEK